MKIKIIENKSVVFILSVILGLGLAYVLKISCNSHNCIVYKAPDYENKIIRYNDKCYEPNKNMLKCDLKKQIIEY